MKFKKTLHAPLFGFLLILSFFVSVYGKSHSKVTFLGVSSSTLPARMSEQLNLPPNIYLSVDQVSPGSPASEAGLEIYDVILQLNDQILVNSPQLKALVRMKKPGDNVELKILRKGKPQTLQVTLSEIDKPFEKRIPHSGFKGLGTLPSDLFSQNFDLLSPNLNSSIRELLKEHGLSQVPQVLDPTKSDSSELDLNNPIHGPQNTPPNVKSFSFSSQQNHIIIADDEGTIEFTLKDGKKYLKATDADGNTVFDGRVDTDQQRKKLPKNIREKLQKIDSSN
ncbi:MAG: PDZ domain-containing protein [Verrucomicrobiota bacterium]|nr:PDZ domain-containing protein [Verrucomicrobiota bacterium]